MIVQSALFALIGYWIHTSSSQEVLTALPLLNILDNPESFWRFGDSILFFIATTLALMIVNLGLYAVFMSSSEGFRIADRESTLMMKEMLHLDKPSSLISLAFGAFGEEMLFRYGGICFIASVLCELGNPVIVALIEAVIITSVIFTVVHSQYSSFGQIIMVFAAGCILGTSLVLSGNVIVAWLAHFSSNIAAILFEPKIKSKLGYEFSPIEKGKMESSSAEPSTRNKRNSVSD